MQKEKGTPPAKPATNNSGLPTNFRRKRRHSEPHLQATKPYKNFVTHWKLETKKPAQQPPPQPSSAGSSPHLQHEQNYPPNPAAGGNWSPSTSEALKSFQQFKKDGRNSPSTPNSRAVQPPPPPPDQQQPPIRWMRRGSLPHIYDTNAYPSGGGGGGGIAHSAIMEEPDQVPEINFPPSQHEYRFPPITLNFPPPPQDVLFRSKDDLAPFLSKKNKESLDKNLPSLHSILQGVSLSDDADMSDEQDQRADDTQQPRSYAGM